MAQKLGTFRIEKEIKNAEELAELLKKHLDPKFQITVGKADKGVKKFFTGNDVDSVTVRKNAYHGILMGIRIFVTANNHIWRISKSSRRNIINGLWNGNISQCVIVGKSTGRQGPLRPFRRCGYQ